MATLEDLMSLSIASEKQYERDALYLVMMDLDNIAMRHLDMGRELERKSNDG